MRKIEKNGAIRARAISGTHVVLVAIDLNKASTKGLLGFAIQRHCPSTNQTIWLRGLKTFQDKDKGLAPGTPVPVSEHPLQTFQWGDYTVEPGLDYSYRVIAVRGQPKNLVFDQEVTVTITTEAEVADGHAIYFNRGVAGSQAYAREFENKKPDIDNPDAPEMKWLSRGLFEALVGFIARADSAGYGLRCAFYEFSYDPVLQALKQAVAKGADIQVLYDGTDKDSTPAAEKAIKHAKVGKFCKPRNNTSYIAHNKFMVLLKDGKPVEVFTGSTNISGGGIFGHSNVGHHVADPVLAAQFMEYWAQLRAEIDRKPLVAWNDEQSPLPATALPQKGTVALFSPRDKAALAWYGGLMGSAKRMVCFTAAFTIDEVFGEVLENDNDVLHYVMKDKASKKAADDARIVRNKNTLLAIGSKFKKGEFGRWLAEQLTGLNPFVPYIHDKYLLVDPLGNDPIVVTGSANFSKASTVSNDENMLVIRGDTRVADIYLGEFMRIFNHLYARYLVEKASEDGHPVPSKATFLKPDDSWVAPYYQPGPKQNARRYFMGA